MPVGNDANTVLLLHMNGASGSTSFTDSSSSAHVVTASVSSTVIIDTTQSKFQGASAVFNGANQDLLQVPDSDDFSFGSGSWTVETWARPTDTVDFGTKTFFSQAEDANNRIHWDGGLNHMEFTLRQGGVNIISVFQNIPTVTSSFHHYAWVRDVNQIKFFIDGDMVVDSTQAGTATNLSAIMTIGHRDRSVPVGGQPYRGHLDEFRVSNVARYTATFTPSTEEFFSESLTATGINPSSGGKAGGTNTTISGDSFVDPPTVSFGGVSATSVVRVDHKTITCDSPAGTANSTVDVVITNPDTAASTLTDAFSYNLSGGGSGSNTTSGRVMHVAPTFTGTVTTGRVGLQEIYWDVGGAPAGEQAIVHNNQGSVLWSVQNYTNQGNYRQNLGAHTIVDGIVVDTLTDGTLYFYTR